MPILRKKKKTQPFKLSKVKLAELKHFSCVNGSGSDLVQTPAALSVVLNALQASHHRAV